MKGQKPSELKEEEGGVSQEVVEESKIVSTKAHLKR